MTAVAEVEEGEKCDLHFTHETAILHIQNIGVEETSGKAESIKLEAKEGLANDAYFKPNDGKWELLSYYGEINIEPVELINGKLPDLYISVMPGTLKDIKLSFIIGGKGYELKLTTHDGKTSKEIVAGKMYTVEGQALKHCADIYSEPKLLKSGEPNSESNPYLIKTKEELEYVRYHLDGHYSLENNITLPDGEDWEPIGDEENQFTGTFDGKKHTISNIKINNENYFQGFFEIIGSTGTVKNLTVTGEISANNYVGGIAGWNEGKITGCTNSVSLSLTAKGGDNAYCGGIAGWNESGTITNCRNTAAIVGEGDFQYIGGIVGFFQSGSITFCTNSGEITGKGESPRVGGIAGYANDLIEACTNIATITGGASAKIGGIVGWGEKCLGCANKGGLVSGSGAVAGGIMGKADVDISKITACYNTGGHSGDGTFNEISNGGTLTHCYSVETYLEHIADMNSAWEDDENSSKTYKFDSEGIIVEK